MSYARFSDGDVYLYRSDHSARGATVSGTTLSFTLRVADGDDRDVR